MSENYEGNPIVSVIVPAHNAAAYLGDALESLRTQTLTDIEVLVVDDGSTDETASVALSYAERDARFRVFRQDDASGRPGYARNVGLRAARGTYVALLDADDVAVPTRLEESARALRSTGASLAFGDFLKFHDRDGTPFERPHLAAQQFMERASDYLDPIGNRLFRCGPQFVGYLLTDIPAVNTPTFFATRADLATVGLFDESLVGGEDLDLFLRLVERYQAVYIDAVLTLMRVHPSSLTATQADRCTLDAIAVRRAHVDLLADRLTPEEQEAATRTIAEMLADLGYHRWVRGARSSARAALAESWRIRRGRAAAVSYLKAWLPREPLLRVWSRLNRDAT